MLSKLLTKQSAKAKNIMLRQRQVVFELMTLFRKCIFKKNVQKNKDKFYFFSWKKLKKNQSNSIYTYFTGACNEKALPPSHCFTH